MDVLTLSKLDYSVGTIVEGHTSLIWTERFQDAGEFTLHTPLIERTRALLPERSLCTLRDSNVVMLVNNHGITTADDGTKELVVTGKTVDTFLKHRYWIGAGYGKSTKMKQSYTIRQAVEVWLWNAIVNATGNDVVAIGDRSDANVLPNVVISDSVPFTSDGTSAVRRVHNGEVYEQMRKFLSAGRLGIRTIRPNGTRGKRVSVSSSGVFSVVNVDPFTKLRFDVYQGRDKSATVQFSYKAGHLDNPSYLFASEDFKTGVHMDAEMTVVGGGGWSWPGTRYFVDADALPGANTGWNKRDGFLDAGSRDDDMTSSEFEDSLETTALAALRRQWKHISLIDTQISPFINYKYNRDYRLGDQVYVQGEYGVGQKMWVTEYIRTEDENGEVGYPTLSTTPS